MTGEEQIGFQFLVENSIDVICRAGVDMVLRYASPSSFNVLGWKPEEMIGRRAEAFALADDAPLFAAFNGHTPSPDQNNSPVTVRMRKKDGEIVWIEIRRRMVLDSVTGEPTEAVIVMRDITERKVLEEKVSALSLTDSLTGLSTRHAFDVALEREWNRTLRENSFLTLLLLDFHHFRHFHAMHGHVEGDCCLAKAAAAVIGVLRTTDFAARYGEEDIAVILPSTGPGGAAKVATKVRAVIQELHSPQPETVTGESWVTVSIGFATAFARPGASARIPELLLLAAQSSLRKSKNRDTESLRRTADCRLGALAVK
jgi:diguanylate cyclase (GGDEF)-like protein/PAS domain S-box-containing protein